LTRAELTELGYIVPIATIPYEYTNLYICPRNPMLFKRQEMHARICVLRVSPDVLDLPNVVVTDSNAGSKYVRFSAAPGGLAIVDRERTFARYWNHPEDEREHWRHSAQKCAEVLVPDVVSMRSVNGAYVSCDEGNHALVEAGFRLPVTRDRDLFFR